MSRDTFTTTFFGIFLDNDEFDKLLTVRPAVYESCPVYDRRSGERLSNEKICIREEESVLVVNGVALEHTFDPYNDALEALTGLSTVFQSASGGYGIGYIFTEGHDEKQVAEGMKKVVDAKAHLKKVLNIKGKMKLQVFNLEDFNLTDER